MNEPDRHTLLRRLADSIDALAYPYRHSEVINTVTAAGRPHRYRHDTRHPPLITQLAAHRKDDEGETVRGRPVYGSAEPVHLHAIDRHKAIETECLAWLKRLRLRPRATLPECLRQLPAAARRLDTDALAELTAAARSWWCWSRTVTGWDSPPWKPWGPCPVCETIGGIRVRVESRTGVCVHCWSYWDAGSLDTLAAYIRLWSQSHSQAA